MTEKLARYQLYKSETTGKYFVKYPESEEREIGKLEYNILLDEKNRILDRYLNSAVCKECVDNFQSRKA